MDKEVLEVVLRKYVTDSSIKRIIEMKLESAVPKGENYTSTILKLTLKVVLGNGRVANKSFILKKENSGEAADQLRNDLQLFKMEAMVYTKILKEMDYLMEEYGDSEGPLWCKFIHFNRADSIIVLEDLKASGFKTVKRSEAQDLDHARLVLRSLGRYHAMAKVLEVRGLISKDDYKPYAMLFDEVYVRSILYGGNQTLIQAMKTSWGKEWAETADKLSQVSLEEFLKRIQDSGNFDDDTFKCLNHGDCWTNNMMFKHDWQGRPIEVRFIDFQVPHYNSPCLDLTYFMYTSIRPGVRHKNFKSLIELYHKSLSSSLDRFGYRGSKPSLEDIEKIMERLLFFGLSYFTAGFPIVSTSRNDALDIDKLFKSNGEEGINVSIYNEEGIIEKLREDLKILVRIHES